MSLKLTERLAINKNRRDKVLISACLLGESCRYDGKSKKVEGIEKLLNYFDLIPICPEVMGGLKTPRDPSEIKGLMVISKKGKNVTEEYNSGAYLASTIAHIKHVKLAVLKENSPSCGVYKIHDGSFTNKLISGEGITTKRLKKENIPVINEEEALELLKELQDENI